MSDAEIQAHHDYYHDVPHPNTAPLAAWDFYHAWVNEQEQLANNRHIRVKTDSLANAHTIAAHVLGADFVLKHYTPQRYHDFDPHTEYVYFSSFSLLPRRWKRSLPGNEWMFPISSRHLKLCTLEKVLLSDD